MGRTRTLLRQAVTEWPRNPFVITDLADLNVRVHAILVYTLGIPRKYTVEASDLLM